MSSFSTMPPSFEQMYCCLRRLPQDLCSMLKLTVAEDSLAEYRDTGTETSPNEMVAVPIARGGICPIYAANQKPARIAAKKVERTDYGTSSCFMGRRRLC